MFVAWKRVVWWWWAIVDIRMSDRRQVRVRAGWKYGIIQCKQKKVNRRWKKAHKHQQRNPQKYTLVFFLLY